MERRSRGFALAEVLTALFFSTALVGLTVKAYGSTPGELAVRQARNVFNGMAARARTEAMESGRTTLLLANIASDSVSIVSQGRVLETVGFSEEMGVRLEAPIGQLRLCMSPRGYAPRDCNSFDSPVTVAFVRGDRSETVEILPRGQIRW